MLTLATAQIDIAPDVHGNGRTIRDTMRQAAEAGARLVHFPEGALSGYVGAQISDWSHVDWPALRQELQNTAALAARLGIWVVLGANHRLRPPRWPHNSLYVISDTGILAGRYDKRMCSNTEVTYWYTPGKHPLVFDVDGIRFGCALCIEVVFPQLFAEYARLGVHCALLSSYSADPIHGVMARAHAATQCTWLSLATPTACAATLPSAIFGPDGHPVAQSPDAGPGILLHTIDPAAQRWHVPLRHARPWRARATSGEIYSGHAARPR